MGMASGWWVYWEEGGPGRVVGVADGWVAYVVVTEQVKVAVRELAAVLREVERAEKGLMRARTHADATVGRAERRLERALGGMSLARWHALASGQASIRTPRDGQEASLAARHQPAVAEALEVLAATRTGADRRVTDAEGVLATAKRRLAGYCVAAPL